MNLGISDAFKKLIGSFGRPSQSDQQPDFGMVTIPNSEPALVAAIEQARNTLPYCLERLASHPERNTDYLFKVAFPTDRGPEYVWVIPVEIDGDRFKGFLAHDPMFIRGKRQWSKVSFSRDQIIDWGFREGEVSYGQFTTRAIAKIGPGLSAEFTDGLSETPLPSDAQVRL